MNSRKTILVIDDQRDIHLLLKALLEHQGYRVCSALDAAQGGIMARQLKPDLVILDITMPAGGGYVAYERLRMANSFTTTPILLYTGVARQEVESKIAKTADTLMLTKPAAPGHIVSAVESLLALH
jgi:DNA-binding response OmpR family regulator